MCLYSKNKTPLVAEEDIHVWKVVTESYKGPYMGRYKYKKGLNRTRKAEDPTKLFGGVWTYGKGWLHACTDLDSAYLLAMNFSDMWLYQRQWDAKITLYIIEMVIPKGSKYVKDNSGLHYCANKLEWRDNADIRYLHRENVQDPDLGYLGFWSPGSPVTGIVIDRQD